jgi:cysteinyl-tRNA synthetase
MTIQIYNTQSRKVEPFETIDPGIVRMYVCGVTPYARAHIGHAMSSIVFDMIKRYLTHRGYAVRHVINFTDIDDKIIARANRDGIDPSQLTEELIAEWHRELAALNIAPADVYPRATQEVPQIIEMIEGLIAKGHAYQVQGDVYYRVRSFNGYGKLSHRSLDDLLSGARIEVDERKDDPLDFALWKATKPGEPWWDSPWGKGRPGWHIECSAMCSHHLGGVVDVHGGGADLIFPHHENEIAQSEAYLGREPFARYWVHNGLLQLGGDKMSKSIGNLVSVDELIKQRRTAAFRLMVLQSHYRAPLTFTDDGLESAHRGLDRVRAALDDSAVATDPVQLDAGIAEATRVDFERAMDNDFDTPAAIAAVFNLVRSIKRSTGHQESRDALVEARGVLRALLDILGIKPEADEVSGEAIAAAPFIDLLLRVRDELRAGKHWKEADAIRDGLSELGISIADGPEGATWRQESTITATGKG